MKILILKPSSLGDVVQALPVLRLLKQHLPQAEVFWWIEAALTPLLEGDPDLAGVIRFERRRWRSPWRWPEVWRSVRALRAQAFDWVIDLQGLARSGWFAWLANGSRLVGLDDTREGARGFYDYVVSRPSYDTHAVDWYLKVLPLFEVPVHEHFDWLPPRPAAAAAVRQQCPKPAAPWMAVLPGARWSNKQWPAGHYAELVRLLARRFPTLHFVVLGSAADRSAGGQIQQAVSHRVLDLTGATTLPEMVEWIRFSVQTVSNDSGPMHVAAALGKPVTALFGPTDPRRTGPYGQRHNVLQLQLPCVPCMKSRCDWMRPLECLHQLPVQAALEHLTPQLAAALAPAEPQPGA